MGFLDTQAPQAIAVVYAFVIREVVTSTTMPGKWRFGSVKGGREFIMTGRGLPQRPFSLTGTQRLTMTWLPGYAAATTQPLGAKEEVTTIKGKWSDKFISSSTAPEDDLGPLGGAFSAVDNAIGAAGGALGEALGLGKKPPANESKPIMWDGTQIENVYEATNVIDEMRRMATYIEVNWGRHSRRGFITKFTQDWLTAYDVEWEIEFTWSSRGEPVDPVVAESLFSTSSTASVMQALSDALNLEALPPTFPMANDLLREITQGIARIAATTQAISDTITNSTALLLSPVAIARSVIGLSSTLQGQCTELQNTLYQQGVGAMVVWDRLSVDNSATTTVSNETLTIGVTSQAGNAANTRGEVHASTANTAKAAEYRGRVASSIKALRSAANTVRDDYRKQLERDALAIVIVREGDDLRTLSNQFFGTPNDWRRIAQANGLTSAKLAAGMQIVIPSQAHGGEC